MHSTTYQDTEKVINRSFLCIIDAYLIICLLQALIFKPVKGLVCQIALFEEYEECKMGL